jgi:hypothetical protein
MPPHVPKAALRLTSGIGHLHPFLDQAIHELPQMVLDLPVDLLLRSGPPQPKPKKLTNRPVDHLCQASAALESLATAAT